MIKKVFWGSGLFIVIFFLHGCHSDTCPPTYSHRFSQGYTTLYPASDKLFYHKIHITDSSSKDTASFVFYFINTFGNFHHYEFRQDNGKAVQSPEGEFIVKFDRHASEDTYSSLKTSVNLTNKKTVTFEMQLSFDPKTVQERNGRYGTKDGLFIRKTDVGFLGILTNDFIPPAPPEDEKEFLRNEFGNKLKSAVSESEKIKILAEEVINMLEPYRGIPGNAMDTLSAVKQLMRLKQNNEKVYCGNIADIFLNACLSFDIPARKVGLGNTWDDVSNPSIFHSDHHSTVEVFNKDEGDWRLVDLSFYLLEVNMETEEALNFVDFFYLFNSPGERNKMTVSEYDVQQKKINVVKISEARNFLKLMDYYKQNQKFFFPHRSGYFSF